LAVEWAKFYVEYYDARDRLCFTLLFATYSNSEQLTNDPRPVESKESRLLLSLGSGLAPASEVTEARVHLISQAILGRTKETVAGKSMIRSPAAIEGTIPERQLHLAIDSAQRDAGVFDLVFAKVAITSEGVAKGITILNSSTSDITAWLQRTIHEKPIFRPATAGFVNIESDALVLVRAAVTSTAVPLVPLARSSTWVKDYVKILSGEVPPITELFFVPSNEMTTDDRGSQQPIPPSTRDPNSVFLMLSGSFWCDALVVWDPISPAHPWTLRWRIPEE